MLMLFRSKSKFRHRSGSKDFSFHSPVHLSSSSSSSQNNINVYLVSLFITLLTGLASPFGIWILSVYGLLCTTTLLIFYYKTIKYDLDEKIGHVKRFIKDKLNEIKYIFESFMSYVDKVEQEFLKLSNISVTINQIVFFTICEKVLLSDQNITALYSLMFYNVISYCFSYMKQMLEKSNWSPYINVASHSTIKHLAMSATKIVLEVTKAVTFVITLVFMLFVLCLEQRLHYYQPTVYFTFFTAIYYLATEKMFADTFPSILSYFQIQRLENLETLWAPVLLSITGQMLSCGFAAVLFYRGLYRGAMIALYLNVYLTYKKLNDGSLRVLSREKAIISPFRYATKKELDEFEDVCAVCLTDMQLARITPCHHIFHTDCLRQCLQTCDKCPVCKRELVFN
ncbi:RING finger protein 145 homolog isoform X2 [Planococcus citri]